MTTDDQIRNAFDDLNLRAGRAAADQAVRDRNPANPDRPGNRNRGPFSRPGLAIAGLAIAVAGGGAVALGLTGGDDGSQEVATDGTTSTLEATPVTDDDQSTASSDDTGDTGGDTSTTDPDEVEAPIGSVETGQRLRVATDLVAADTTDPFLNARREPGSGAELLAKLPSTYTGLVATGETMTVDDGGIWIEVELLHPVAVEAIAPDTGRPPAGWVNAAFVDELPDGLAVGTDEIPACNGDTGDESTTGGLGTGYVYGLESGMVADDCLRIVMTFAAGQSAYLWDLVPGGTGPATALPGVFTSMSGGMGVSIELNRIDSAWPGATETGDGVYLVRQDDRTLELVIPSPANVSAVHTLVDRGIVVIDLDSIGTAPPNEHGVVLTGDALVGRGSIDVTGLARPFEATLGVELVDGDGEPVEAVFSGSVSLRTRRSSEYGVGVTDWVEAWGRWAVRVEGLDPGSYVLRFDGGGGIENPPTLDLAFEITEAGDPPTLATEQEAAVAEAVAFFGPNSDPLPLADEVILALGPDIQRTATAAELADPEGWWMDEADGFGGFDGPFSPIAVVDHIRLRVTAGPVPYCAGPPRDWPAEFDGLRQVNLEPIGIDSCIAWFGVHLFLDDQDRIAAVSLDLFGP